MHLGTDLPLGPALLRVASEQIEIALDGFSLPQEDEQLDLKVHLGRKAIKRTRAVVRLVRDQVGAEDYRAANTALRDQARRLSELRTARVLVTTLEAVAALDSLALLPEDITGATAELEKRRTALISAIRGDGVTVPTALRVLNEVRDHMASWQLSDEFFALEPNIKRVYRRGRRALRLAQKTRTAHELHDWRKRVNYLRYQIEALGDGFPAVVATTENALNVLSETLGDEHDMAELSLLIAQDAELMGAPDLRARMLEAIRLERRFLQDKAFAEGALIYADRPARFLAKLVELWRF